jgi:hypothetical protein
MYFCSYLHVIFLHAIKASSFTFHPKESVLWIFIALKSPSPHLGFNPWAFDPVASTTKATGTKSYSAWNICSSHRGLMDTGPQFLCCFVRRNYMYVVSFLCWPPASPWFAIWLLKVLWTCTVYSTCHRVPWGSWGVGIEEVAWLNGEIMCHFYLLSVWVLKRMCTICP